MEASAGNSHIMNIRITHQKSGISLIETAAVKDLQNALKQFHANDEIDECVILQTCNRTEAYVVSKEPEKASEKLKEHLLNRFKTKSAETKSAIEICSNQDALKHLLRVSSGLESMVIGEDQILGQVWDAYRVAKSAKTVGPVLKTVFTRAVSVGRRVRNETKINRGAVSVGSVAVELAETLLGNLCGKTVLIMGAGETGTLVAKALATRCPNAIFIANRTYERAVKLADELQGKAVKFDKLEDVLKDADVIICSTSAPHYLLKKEPVSKIMEQRVNRKGLMIIDISNPRNVERSVQEIDGVNLYNIDDLREIADRNKDKRAEKAEKASKIVDESLFLLEQDLKAQSVSDIVAFLFAHAEEIRQKELIKAQSMLGNLDPKKKGVIDSLTFEIVEQTLVPIVAKLRNAAVNGDKQMIDAATELFKLKNKNKSGKKLEKTALILIGHGSKLPHNRETLDKLAEQIRNHSKVDTVEIAFMVRNKPTIPETLESAVKNGAKKIVMIPAFIAHGVHTKDEIPEIIKTKQEELGLKAKGVEVIYGEPLGADERIVEIIEDKALTLLGQESNDVKKVQEARNLKASTKMYNTSIKILRPFIKDIIERAPETDIPIIERVVHTTADPEFAKLLVINKNAVKNGVAAIKAGAKIVTDVKMVQAGINKTRIKRFGGQILTYVDDRRAIELAKQESITRSAAAMQLAVKDGLDNAIVVIGNAPTAAFEIAKAVIQGLTKPALIIATPVGYVEAAESKEEIANLSVPFIIIKGPKGGSALAVAIFNAILGMAETDENVA
ncbi:MAG: glutamyl-tRNA reductase [Candidatus Bathyarchaeota archaeon]|nr:glutamyl-tRNA reductase [Candidatus Bathyarchaeum tardum]